MSRLNLIIRKFKGINILKTLYVNFAYFSFSTAIKFPIFIYGKTCINAKKGRIYIDPKSIRAGILNIGTPILDFQHRKTQTVFNIKGKIHILGKVIIGKGCAIEVCKDGFFSIGSNTTITGNTTICCAKSIKIGEKCMISWDNLIMDSDWHNIIATDNGQVFPKQKAIVIGDHVWIGCRCTILKGANICNDSIVASNSKLTKAIEGNNILIGSNTIIRINVTW